MIDKAKAQLQRKHAEVKTNKDRHAGTEKSFMQEEFQAQKFLDALIELVVYHDMEMRVLWANRAACQSVGLDLEQVVGRHCYEIWPQRADPCDDCPVMLSRETGSPQSVEKKTPDERYWHIKCAPVFGTNGKMVAIVELTIDISERKGMEEALKKSEARHRSLVETIPHGIQEIDPQGTITFANPAHDKIYGYSGQEMIGKSILDMQISGSAKNELRTYLAKLVEEQPEPTPYTVKNYTKDNRVIDVQVDWNYKKDDRGRVTGFTSVVTDITEKIRTEEALQQAHVKLEQRVQDRTAELLAANERLILEVKERKNAQEKTKNSEIKYQELNVLFQMIIDTVPDLIWAKDLDDRFMLVNPAICNKLLLCGNMEEAIGKTDVFFAERERNNGYIHTFGEMCINSDAITKERKVLGRFLEEGLVRGQDLVLDTYKAPLFNENCELIGTVGCGRDVTEEKRKEKALKASQTELDAFFNNTPVATVIVDHKIRVLKANRAAMEATSRLEEEIIGHCSGEVLGCFHAIDDPRGCGLGPLCKTCEVRLAILESLQSGKPIHEVEATLPLTHEKERQKVNLLVSTTPFRILEKDMVVVCLQDVTRRKQAEKRNIELNQTLVQRTDLAEHRATYIQQLAMELSNAEDRERQRLARVLHDDLQQMLAYLKIKLTTLPASVDIANNINTLSNLIDQCIDRCRNLARELKPLGLRRNDFLAALKSLCRQMKEMYGLTVALQAKVDPGIQSSVLSSLLIRSIRELLFNVVKHSGAKHASVDVRVDGRQMLITVKDTGSGCDPGVLKQKKDDLGAFGLLDIEDRVNFLGGAMNVECESGKEFCVTLWVPRDLTCPSDTHQPTSDVSRSSELKPDGPAVVPADSLAGRSIRVMLADDHQIMRDGLAELINGQDGIDVVGMAANGQEVVQLAVKLIPDVILMDVSMPVMNGIDATKQISASLPSVRIIGLTMHKDPDIHQAMLIAGACACHSKSGSPEELIKTIELAKSGRTVSSREP